MKAKSMRILTMICTICLLIGIMVTPAFALSVPSYLYSEPREKLKDTTHQTVDVLWATSYNGNSYNGNQVKLYYSGGLYLGFYNGGSQSFAISYEYDGSLSDNQDYWAYMENLVIYSPTEQQYSILGNWFIFQDCDNSVCVTTDADNDGVCDNCGLTVPEPIEYSKYNNAYLPDIDTVWTDKYSYPVAIVFKDKSADNYHLVIGQNFEYDHVHINTNASGSPECYCSITNWKWYNLSGDEWVYETGATNSVVCRTETYSMVWTSETIYTDSTRETPFTDFFPKAPTLAGVMTEQTLAGVMTEVVAMMPIVMACLVGYLALRKALAILRETLHQA